jgi:hypothetical protein
MVFASLSHTIGNITLVHNGTLRQYPFFKDHQKDSDSKIITRLLNDNPNFVEVEQEFTGAWALVWHDARDNSFNIARNGERPLALLEDENGVIWLASEPKMVELVLGRNETRIVEIKEVPVRVWLKFTPDNKIIKTEVPWVVQPKKDEKPTIKKEKGDEEERAKKSVFTGGSVKKFSDTFGFSAELPKEEKPPLPVPYNSPNMPDVSSSLGRVTKGPHKKLDEYSGMRVGDSIFFQPTGGAASTNDVKKTIFWGPLAVFVENGEDPLEFLPGVEVRGRLIETLDDPGELMVNKLAATLAPPRLAEAVITSIIYNPQIKRIVLWVKDVTPQDWAELKEWEIDFDKAHKAYAASLEEYSIPEVMEREKKSGAAECTTC